jgi:putative transposase
VRSQQTNGVVERLSGTLKYEHLYRATIGDGNALATLRPLQALDERTSSARLTSPSSTAISVWPLADPLLDWEVLT